MINIINIIFINFINIIQCVCESMLPSHPTPAHPPLPRVTGRHHPVRVWEYVTIPTHPTPTPAHPPLPGLTGRHHPVRVWEYFTMRVSTARRVTAKLPVLRPWFWNLMFPEKKIMVSPRALVAQLGATDCLRCLMCGSRWLSCVYWMMSVRDLFRKTVIWRPVILFLFHGHQNGT